ncbi:MAG: LLM class flavin-dependent oxidoreductase [Candidatus Binataceae bacterium]
MDFGIFYEIQVNSPLKYREREYQAFHDVLRQVETAEQVGFSHFWTVEHHLQVGFAHPGRFRPLVGARSAVRRDFAAHQRDSHRARGGAAAVSL